MKRDARRLAQENFDILVIGGGIYGACIAWDAALRGLSVALIEKEDFGHATSANSLKILHGGLRYLQDASLRLVRTMVHERRTLIRIAPHLIQPLPCVMPTYPQLMRSKMVMGAALLLNDVLGYDRNRHLANAQQHLPRGEIISREEALQRMPAMVDASLTGGAVWYDAQILDTERFTLSFLLSAAEKGATVANYVEATGLLLQDARAIGVSAQDRLSGEELTIRAAVVVNATGPWLPQLLGLMGQKIARPPHRPSVAMNLVTRQIHPEHALAIPGREKGNGSGDLDGDRQTLFIVPWREYSLIGTKHYPFDGEVSDYVPSKELALNFLDEVNSAYPGVNLMPGDVRLIHTGFLPDERDAGSGRVKLVRQSQVVDHLLEDGVEGLISVVSVKYTTARLTAEQTVDRVFQKLGRPIPQSKTDCTPLFGGENRIPGALDNRSGNHQFPLNSKVLRHLTNTYGAAFKKLSAYSEEFKDWSKPVCPETPVIKAQIVHAVR
jgi:glycerol-3-phosphate dehydrogenase